MKTNPTKGDTDELPENIEHLLRFNCPNGCDGKGSYPETDGDGEWEQGQCQWCFQYGMPGRLAIKQYASQREIAGRELFIPIRGYEGSYEISNMGQVRSLARGILLKKCARGGYQVVTLANGKSRTFTVHRLVAGAFLSNPKGKRTVNHKNGIKDDNRLENLEWATHSENERHARETLGKKPWNINTREFEDRTCPECGNSFTVEAWNDKRCCTRICGRHYRERLAELKNQKETL